MGKFFLCLIRLLYYLLKGNEKRGYNSDYLYGSYDYIYCGII